MIPHTATHDDTPLPPEGSPGETSQIRRTPHSAASQTRACNAYAAHGTPPQLTHRLISATTRGRRIGALSQHAGAPTTSSQQTSQLLPAYVPARHGHCTRIEVDKPSHHPPIKHIVAYIVAHRPHAACTLCAPRRIAPTSCLSARLLSAPQHVVAHSPHRRREAPPTRRA